MSSYTARSGEECQNALVGGRGGKKTYTGPEVNNAERAGAGDTAAAGAVSEKVTAHPKSGEKGRKKEVLVENSKLSEQGMCALIIDMNIFNDHAFVIQ